MFSKLEKESDFNVNAFLTFFHVLGKLLLGENVMNVFNHTKVVCPESLFNSTFQ